MVNESIIFIFIAAALTGISYPIVNLFIKFTGLPNKDIVKYSCCFAGWYMLVGGIFGIVGLALHEMLTGQMLQLDFSANLYSILIVSLFSAIAYAFQAYGLSKLTPTLATVLALIELIFIVDINIVLAVLFGKSIPNLLALAGSIIFLIVSVLFIAIGVREKANEESREDTIIDKVVEFLKKMKEDRDTKIGFASIILASLFFALQIVASDQVLKTVPAPTLSAMMLTIGGLILLMLTIRWQKLFYKNFQATRKKIKKRFNLKTTFLRNRYSIGAIVVFIGFLKIAAWIFYYLTQRDFSSAVTGICFTTNVIFVALVQWYIFISRLKSRIYTYTWKHVILAVILSIVAIFVLNLNELLA